VSNEQEIHITFTTKQAVAIIVALVAILGTYPVANLVTPNARIDPFTGTEGEDLEGRLYFVEIQQKQIMQDDMQCKKRQESLEKELKWLHDKVVTYQATTKQVDAHQSKLIADCMKRTQ